MFARVIEMGRVDTIVTATLADLFVNLSAGWLIVAFGAPFLSGYGLLTKIDWKCHTRYNVFVYSNKIKKEN